MRISGSGIASTGMRAIKQRKQLYHAQSAISCLHDALLAVAKGMLTPEQVKDFFWYRGTDDASFYGDVLRLTEEPKPCE